MRADAIQPPDFPLITSEDLRRPGINTVKLFSSELVVHRSRYRSLLGPQTHGGSSAAVDWNIEIGPFDVLSQLRPAYGITPDTPILSDERDFKSDRASCEPDDLTGSPRGRTGGGQTNYSVGVKLLRCYSRSQAGLVVIKQVSNVTSRVASGYPHLPEVLPPISEVETDFTSELSPHP